MVTFDLCGKYVLIFPLRNLLAWWLNYNKVLFCCRVTCFIWMFTFNYLAAFQKSSEQIAKLQKLHEEELASKEQELTKKLQTQETEFQEQMRIALVSTYSILFFPYYKVVTPSSLPSRLRSRYSQPWPLRMQRDWL